MTTYNPKGVCARLIEFSIDENNCLHDVTFMGGCNGNLKAIGRLVEGQDAQEIASLLKGNTCGPRGTSCADQLACAIEETLQS